MDYFIIISVIVVFFLGFIFIDKICLLIEPNDFAIEEKNVIVSDKKSDKVLLFGNHSILKDILIFLEKRNISYTIITNTNELNKSDSYKYLLAIDELDLENLVICSLGKKLMGIPEIIAICNDAYNKKIFEDNHIPYLCGENISAYQLISTLFSHSQNSGGKTDVHI